MRSKTISKMRVISVIMSLLMVISVISFPTLNANADGSAGTLDDFVERCYTVTLDRPSDVDGFNYWKGRVLNGEAVGIEVAYGFLFSPEYTKKNKDNDAYLKDLYMLFMGREPDESGYNDWMNKLNSGVSRLEVFAGFANSTEFYNICDSYGITSGRYVMGYDRKTINNVNLYVERMYKICLGRIGDKDGQNDWAEKLMKKEISGSECARSFIFSREYINKGLSDEEFVENLYLAMFGRSSDAEGKYNWLFALKNGMTRDEVFAGFANSIEFDNICKAYGINRGNYVAKDKGTYKPKNGGDDNTASGNNTLGEHTHVYGIENTSSEYLKSLANCTTPATYYYSCKCGAKGEETFTRGEALGHNFQDHLFMENDKYLKSPATCKEAATYYYACYACGEIDYTRTYKYGEPDSNAHKYDAVANFQKRPTLTENGFEKRACLNGCGNVKTDIVPSILSQSDVGDVVLFGTYEQYVNVEPGDSTKDSISWIVAGEKDGKKLLISQYALDCQPYEESTSTGTTWATSSLRTWLNNDFKNAAFSEEELKWVAKTKIINNDNPYYSTGVGGDDTKDYVFIPSMEELKGVFKVDYSDSSSKTFCGYDFVCIPTEYAVKQGAYNHNFTDEERAYYKNQYGGKYVNGYLGGGTNYWVRDPGMDTFRKSLVNYWGEAGKNIHEWQYNSAVAVRPAIYLKYEK